MPRIRTAGFWGKFGKKPARRDRRNFAFAALIARSPSLPAEYDFDERRVAVPTPMFGNDLHGDCVIAGRAHQTLRFEYLEQKRVLDIGTADVLREWHHENGGTEAGLVVLDSLKEWRTGGWKVGKARYRIQAFSEVDRGSPLEIRKAIFMQVGVGLGLTLPYDALGLFNSGKIWDVTRGPGGRPDPQGGHYVYCPGYTKRGPVCVTWGRRQPMTWAFFERFCDEAYAIVDARDAALKRAAGVRGALDMKALRARLAEVDR
jgi:hypothetical protein